MHEISIDLSLIQPILERYEDRSRSDLLPLLYEAQEVYGWLPGEVQAEIGKTLRVPLADIHGVVEFYTMLYNRPTAPHVIRVCEDPACHLAGGMEIIESIETQLGLQHSQTSSDGGITYERVPCLGMCDHAPAALHGEKPAGELTVDNLHSFIDGKHPEPNSKVYGDPRFILARAGRINPESLEDYQNHGGYQGLKKAIQMEPSQVIDMVEDSGILGRGGAMFPTGRKWRFTREAEGAVKHIVVNADESEPGTFKDRCLMEEDPFAIIEAATLAGYAVGAKNGWIFVRGEFPRSYNRLKTAIEKARASGLLEKNILGKAGFDFDIKIRKGAGAYICGEETALFEAIEGKRGFPRIKPPFPTTHGLFQQPTVVNNVETLAAVLAAFNMGAEEWKKYGTKESPGTKLFCLSGHIEKPGVYEVPFGLTIRQLIEMAGGVPDGNEIQAVMVGGAAGVFVTPDKLDMPLTYEESRSDGTPLGSGVVMVFDQTVDLRDTLYQIARFFAHESCGKCFPCQLGTQRQMEILDRVAHDGGVQADDKDTLLDIGFAMTETSLCGLGQTASSAVVSAVRLWPELVE